ncbi:MAG: Hsp20/alpha crystallin family protein [Verrucomicrobiales bacterium]|jgi:HSP20 family protein|nr:Hsp20/alpha crystallin family protein [Verrucomicrobiales bacterium]
MKIVQWNPAKELDEFQHRLSSFFNRREEGVWAPLVDVVEEEKDFVIKAEIPDVDRENIKVTVSDGVLTLSGERKFEQENRTKTYHRVERGYGSFARSFTLPEAVEAEKVTADCKNGLLTVRVPKAAKSLPREVEVKIS